MTAHSSSTYPHGDEVKIVRISDRQKELDKLPPPETKRWVMRRKAQVVAAVIGFALNEAAFSAELTK